MPLALLPGTVVKAQSGFFMVHTQSGDFVCHLRGRLKKEKRVTDLIAVGDRVEISTQPDGGGMIETIAPRRSALARTAPSAYGARGQRRGGGDTQQVIVANVDQVVLVFACAEPAPRLRMLDRFLVVAECAGLPALICANKSLSAAAAANLALGFGLEEAVRRAHGFLQAALREAYPLGAGHGPTNPYAAAGVGRDRVLESLREAWEVLEAAHEVYLRTRKHPSVSALPRKLILHSFDELYESAADFDQVYTTIASEVLTLGRRPQGVIYAVPGHPLVGEASVGRILDGALEAHVAVHIIAGMSIVEPVLTALGIDALVEHLDVVEQLHLRLAVAAELVSQLVRHGREEALHHRVVRSSCLAGSCCR